MARKSRIHSLSRNYPARSVYNPSTATVRHDDKFETARRRQGIARTRVMEGTLKSSRITPVQKATRTLREAGKIQQHARKAPYKLTPVTRPTAKAVAGLKTSLKVQAKRLACKKPPKRTKSKSGGGRNAFIPWCK